MGFCDDGTNLANFIISLSFGGFLLLVLVGLLMIDALWLRPLVKNAKLFFSRVASSPKFMSAAEMASQDGTGLSGPDSGRQIIKLLEGDLAQQPNSGEVQTIASRIGVEIPLYEYFNLIVPMKELKNRKPTYSGIGAE